MNTHLVTGMIAPLRRTCAALGLALSFAVGSSSLTHADSHARALADPDSSHAAPTYRQLIDEALHEYNAQHFAKALSLFERAHEVWPNARTLRGLGKVSFELRRYRAAIDYLERARASKAQPLDDPMRRDAERLEAHARSYLGRVRVELEPKSAELRLDGSAERIEPDRTLLLDPGEHVLEVVAPGFVTERHVYALSVAEQTTWAIRLRAVPASAPTGTTTTPRPRPTFEANALAISPRTAALASSESTSSTSGPTDTGASRHWLLPTGLTLAFVGAATTGVATGLFVAYLDSGDKLRQPNHLTLQYRERWLRSRDRTLVVSGIGSGLLTLGAAALAETIPPAERRWLSPALAAVGTAVLVTGISLYAANSCDAQQTLRACSLHVERHDAGSLLAMVSIPLLTIPIIHAVEWLINPK